MITFHDFCHDNPFSEQFIDDSVMQEVFDLLVQNIGTMINSIKKNRPALEPVLADVEQIFSKRNNPLDDFKKQTVGRMASFILKPFGYVAGKEVKLLPSAGTKNFENASLYHFDSSGS